VHPNPYKPIWNLRKALDKLQVFIYPTMKARNNTLLQLAIKSIGMPLVVAASMIQVAHSQTTVTYTMQDANFPTQFNSGGDFFNSGSTELGMWANSGSKQTVGWQNFSTTGAAGGTARNLQVGDVFTTTVSASRAFGQIGFSLNAGGTQGSSYANNISGSRMYISTDNYAAWSVKGLSGGGTSSLSYVPLQDTYKDYRFTIRITSQTTADAYLTVDGTDYRAYNLTLAGTAGANISSFSIFGSDMWDGNSNDNAYWKQTTSVQNSGRVELGYYAGSSSTLTPGIVTDGLAANSTSTTSANAVFVGGDAGSQVNLTQNNTYTGATTINALATAEAQHANALGTTAAGTTVTNTGTLKLWSASSISYASEALTINGLGRAYGDVAGDAGALRSNGGNNTWNGNITLGSSSRINSDTAGGAGSLTIAGNISGGSNVLYLGTKVGASANIAISGAISGAGGSQDGTTTSLFKDGANTLTLSGNNTYSGDTRITNGALTVASGGTLGDGSSDVFISSAGSLNVNTNTTVASVQETGSSNGGTIAIGNSAILTVNGASKGTLFQNSISGLGGLTMNGSGNTTLSLYGTQSYSGATRVSGGKISSGVALATSGVTIDGGTFETSAANILGDSASVNLSSGTYALGGNDTIGSLTISGGSLTGSSTLTAATYALNGGTVSANLGAGSLSVGGNSTLNGTSAATTVSVSTGTLSLGGSNRLATGASVSLAAGTGLNLGANSQQLAGLTGDGAVTTSASGSLNLNIASGSSTFAGSIGGAGGLTKSGNGTLFLSGSNSLTGATNVSAGTLRVNGSIGGDATVASGATLGGTGSIAGAVNVTGILSPGASIESLAVGSTSFNTGSTFEWEFNSSNLTADLLDVTGALNLTGTVGLNLIDLASSSIAITEGTKFSLISYTGSWNSGTFSGYADDSVFKIGVNDWKINYNDITGGGNFSSEQSGAAGFVTMTVVPEPSAAALTLFAGGLLATRRRRKA
jgi:autotransporter-associated beta strand protein